MNEEIWTVDLVVCLIGKRSGCQRAKVVVRFCSERCCFGRGVMCRLQPESVSEAATKLFVVTLTHNLGLSRVRGITRVAAYAIPYPIPPFHQHQHGWTPLDLVDVEDTPSPFILFEHSRPLPSSKQDFLEESCTTQHKLNSKLELGKLIQILQERL